MDPKPTYSEGELVAQLLQQDEQSFGYLYDNYSGALFGVISQIIPDKEIASDVLQEVFVNIWRKIGSYDAAKGRLFTWMLNVARNAAIDKIRSKSYQEGLKNLPLPPDANIAGQQVILRTDDFGLRKLVSRLKDEQKLLVELSYFQGYTHEEIAKSLSIPLGTVKTRIRSALIQLRNLIAER
ncbi:MAG TPA: sigma-70 family RNA polymerase sigma factor [Chitinophagaceae bacterium]